ncbi:MAG: CBS domain-containing protein, partial [Erysipelotrichaceae bacterium]|nr:CBS domain-containing protein [Erysipelotrichaceae bacterium]
MTTNFIAVRYGLSLDEKRASMIEQAKENDNIGTIYLLNDNDTLHGAIDLRDFLTAKNEEELEEGVITSYPYVYADDMINNEALDKLIDYDEDSIPVLSERTNEVLGVITAQDLAEVTFDEIDEPEEPQEAPIIPEEKKSLPYMVLCGIALLIIAALLGHTGTASEVGRETAFIICLIAGAAASILGIYLANRKKEVK